MSLDDFKARLAASREKWVSVGGGREILFRRPPYALQCELRDKSTGDEGYMLALLVSSAKDWRGFTADVLLPGDTPEPLAFDSDLLQAAFDNIDLRAQIVSAYVEFWVGQNTAKDAAEKN